MTRKRYTYHPACLLFPKLGEAELRELAQDIKARGLLRPIVCYQGRILDGRNRLAACRLAGVEPKFVEWNGPGSPIEWVISTNLFRRHLTSGQRAVIAHDLLPLLQGEAKQRQRLSRGRGKKGAQDCATFSSNGKASEVAARIVKTNARYVEMIKGINAIAPELIGKIREGKLNVPEANDLARLPPEKRIGVLRQMVRAAKNGATLYGFRGGDYAADAKPSTIYTPPEISRFLYDLISQHYKVATILDPCAGNGALTRPWKAARVISFEITRGKDFLAYQGHAHCDLVLCNPPFNGESVDSRQFMPGVFLAKIIAVTTPHTPIVLFAPMGLRLNQHRSSRRWRWLRDAGPELTSIVSLPIDAFVGVEFHSEILLFNMPKLKPHYFLPDEYLPNHARPDRQRRRATE
jgi:hypothetical protein